LSIDNQHDTMDFVIKQLEEQSEGAFDSYRIIRKRLGEEKLKMVEITMLDGESKLLYMPLPSELEKKASRYCMSQEMGIYHHVKPSALYALQPRRTICYSHAYNYSKTKHPVEETTPARITRLYDITNSLFDMEGEGAGVNMDLVNSYSCGRESISAHSDNERQFGALKDVFCWVFGPAARLGIFRGKKNNTEGAEGTELRIKIPQGLYVMCGLSFQKNYTHEFPELHPALFKRLCKALGDYSDFPTKVPLTDLGASQKTLVQAEWIKKNKDFVTGVIYGGGVSQGKKIKTDLAFFKEWCLERTSHTLRQFVTK
jgi:hypothetical protein